MGRLAAAGFIQASAALNQCSNELDLDVNPPLAYEGGVHVVVETAPFIAAARAAGLSGTEVDRIVEHLARHPDAGDPIQGTGGARKLRFAGRGKGKSGGDRVITLLQRSGPAGVPAGGLRQGRAVRSDQGGAQCSGAALEGAGRGVPVTSRQAWVTS